MCPCVFTASTEAGGTSRRIRLDFQFFLLFRLFSRCSPSLGSASSWGPGMGQRQREVEPHSMEQGVSASRSTDQGIFVLVLPQFYSLLTPSTAFHVDFSFWVPRAWCNPPKTSPFVHPKSPREWPGGSPGPEAQDGCRERGCGSRLSAHAWHKLRGEAGKDRIQVPGEHGFGSVEKSGLLQTPTRVAGMVLVRRGCWVRPVID